MRNYSFVGFDSPIKKKYPRNFWKKNKQTPLIKKKKKIFFFKPQSLNHFHITLNVDQICKKYRIYKALDIKVWDVYIYFF